MTPALRITWALLYGLFCGAAGAAGSLAVGTAHIWPGALVAGSLAALIALAVTGRTSR